MEIRFSLNSRKSPAFKNAFFELPATLLLFFDLFCFLGVDLNSVNVFLMTSLSLEGNYRLAVTRINI